MFIESKYTTNSPVTYRQFKKMLGIKEPKIPRKLKKAARHIMTIHHRPPTVALDGNTIKKTAYISWQTIGGYPYTKWVKKAIGRSRHQYEEIVKMELKRMVEEYSQPIDFEEIKRRAESFKIKIQ